MQLELRKQIIDLLGMVAQDNDVSFRVEGFSPVTIYSTPNKGGTSTVVDTLEVTDDGLLKRGLARFGIEPAMAGSTFYRQGKTYRITGYSPTSPKYPFLVTDIKTGRVYKYTADGIKSVLRSTGVSP